MKNEYEEEQEDRVRVAPNIGAGSHPQSMSDPAENKWENEAAVVAKAESCFADHTRYVQRAHQARGDPGRERMTQIMFKTSHGPAGTVDQVGRGAFHLSSTHEGHALPHTFV